MRILPFKSKFSVRDCGEIHKKDRHQIVRPFTEQPVQYIKKKKGAGPDKKKNDKKGFQTIFDD